MGVILLCPMHLVTVKLNEFLIILIVYIKVNLDLLEITVLPRKEVK
jgi:hypothetical protein